MLISLAALTMMDTDHQVSWGLSEVCRPVRIVHLMRTTDAILWLCSQVLDVRMLTMEAKVRGSSYIELTLVILPPTALDKLSIWRL
jgi:hypothetical protein